MDNFNSTNSSPDGSGWNRPYELGVMHELKHAADMDRGNFDKTKSNGIEKSEIDACRETNKVLKELKEKSWDIRYIRTQKNLWRAKTARFGN